MIKSFWFAAIFSALTLFSGACVSTPATAAVSVLPTHIKFINTTTDVWAGEYHGNSFVMPPGTTQFDINVTEPGAWAFVFGDEFTGGAFGDDTFDSGYEGVTFEYTVAVEIVEYDDGSGRVDRNYTVTRQTY